MSTLKSLADQQLPLEAASLEVRDDALVRRADELLRFAFSWSGVHFVAQAQRDPEGGGRLDLQGDLGPMPFSAEGMARRVDVAAILVAGRDLGWGGFSIGDDRRVRVAASSKVATPLTPVTVLSGVTAALLAMEPWVRLLDMFLQLPKRR